MSSKPTPKRSEPCTPASSDEPKCTKEQGHMGWLSCPVHGLSGSQMARATGRPTAEPKNDQQSEAKCATCGESIRKADAGWFHGTYYLKPWHEPTPAEPKDAVKDERDKRIAELEAENDWLLGILQCRETERCQHSDEGDHR